MNDKEYGALKGIRRSDLWVMNQTPMHFKYHMDNPEQPTPALIFGQAAHKFILEWETFDDEFAVIPPIDRRTKAGKEEFAEFQRIHKEQQWISADDFATIKEMRNALMDNEEIASIITNTAHEVPVTWTDEETGEDLKVKADMIDETNRIVYDYKTAISCADGAFEKSARRHGYDFQAGFYTEGVSIDRFARYGFAFIAQEKTPPYAARIYRCDEGFINRGKRLYRRLLDQYHECKEIGEWPGYIEETLYGEEY